MTGVSPSIVEKLATHFVGSTGYSMRYARAVVRAHEGNLEAALQAHMVASGNEDEDVKERLELFNVSSTASSSTSKRRLTRSRRT